MFEDLVQLSATLPAKHERRVIANGVMGTAQTIAAMQKLVAHGKRDYERVGSLTRQLIADCPHKDFLCQARRCFDYVQNEIAYVYDPVGVEMLVEPARVIAAKGGDCDDKVVLLAAMLEGIGIRCEFVTLKADSSQPDEYSHVYLRAHVPGSGPVAMDTTMQHPMGWEPPPHFGVRAWPASLDKSEDQEVTVGNLGSLAHHRRHHGWYGPGYFGPYIDYGPLVIVDETPRVELTAEEKKLVCAKRPKDDPLCAPTAGSVLGLGVVTQPKPWLNAPVTVPQVPGRKQRRLTRPRTRPVGAGKFRSGAMLTVAGLHDTGTLCKRPALSGMGALGDDLGEWLFAAANLVGDAVMTPTVNHAIRSVIDGTYAQAIRDANAELNAQTQSLTAAAQRARVMDSASQQRILTEVARGREQVAQLRQHVIEATGKYNYVAGELRRVGVSVPSPNLRGLGVVWAIPPAATLAAIAAAAVALALLIDSMGSAVRGGKGTLENINGILGSSSSGGGQTISTGAGTDTYTDSGIVGVISQVGKQGSNLLLIAAAIGAGYVGYLWLKKSKRI